MNLGKTVKKATTQVPIIPTDTPPFGLGKPTDDDLLEMEVRRMARTKADYMDPDAMTTLLGDPICNIEEEGYWEACQHALKSPYEVRISDKDEEGGEAPSDSDEGGNSKSDSSSDSSSSDNRNSEDDSNSDCESNNSEDYDSQYSGSDWGEPPSDREDEDEGLFYKDFFDDDVDYYDGDIEDDAKAKPIDMESGIESEEYELENVLEAIGDKEEVENEEANDIDYDDYPYWRSSVGAALLMVAQELGSLTPYTEEENDIDARLATLDIKLMIHSLRNLTLESLEDEDRKIEGNESE
ncbi:hypothetical protein SO802_021517 [Lithocarpus litseifolius]|uniref:Uncharacterized protein n=1 Tax=Lithocarpus litseifolius TaxID=425828 RepID=A0AAW2CFD1_9ROSI